MSLTLDGVTFGYPKAASVLRDVTLSVSAGEMVAVMGPSGSGKTTLLQIMGGILKPRAGIVEGLPAASDIRWVFQSPILLSRRSVIDNVMLGIHQRRLAPALSLKAAEEAIRAVGLIDAISQRAGSISGGQAQRTQIARSLVSESPLVLVDEPTGQLDHENTELVVQALASARRPGSMVIVATHDLSVADCCDRRIAIHNGMAFEDTP